MNLPKEVKENPLLILAGILILLLFAIVALSMFGVLISVVWAIVKHFWFLFVLVGLGFFLYQKFVKPLSQPTKTRRR